MTNLSVTGECTNSMAQFGKGFGLSMVHPGVNKMSSNDAIIENYQTAIAGQCKNTGYVIMAMALYSH